MGQYYRIVNPKKRQYLHAHKFGDCLGLLEFGSSGSGTMLGLAVLLASSNGRGGGDLNSDNPIIGSWAGDPIVIAGDYADEGEHVPPKDIEKFRQHMNADPAYVDHLRRRGIDPNTVVPTLYDVADALYEDISDKVILALCDGPYERKALVERGVEAAKNWKPPAPPAPPADSFSID